MAQQPNEMEMGFQIITVNGEEVTQDNEQLLAMVR